MDQPRRNKGVLLATDIRDNTDSNHERKRENLFYPCYLCSKKEKGKRTNSRLFHQIHARQVIRNSSFVIIYGLK